MDAGTMLLMQFAENEQREGLTEFECCRVCEELRRANPKWSLKDLAEALNKDPAWVTRHLSVSKVIPAIREAFEAGRIKLKQVYPISQVGEREQHEFLAAALCGSSGDDLVRAVKRTKRPTKGVRSSRISCPLPSGVTVTVSGAEISMDEGIEALTAAAKEMKRALAEGLDAKTAQAVWRDRARKEPANVV